MRRPDRRAPASPARSPPWHSRRPASTSRIVEAHPPRQTATSARISSVSPNGLDALDVDRRAARSRRQEGFADAAQRAAEQLGTHARRTSCSAQPLDRRHTVALTMKRSRLASPAGRRGRRVAASAIELGRRLRHAARRRRAAIVATFDDGIDRARPTCSIGADGVHSVVRRLIDPSAPDGALRRADELRRDHLGGSRSGHRHRAGDVAVRLRPPRVLRRPARHRTATSSGSSTAPRDRDRPRRAGDHLGRGLAALARLAVR